MIYFFKKVLLPDKYFIFLDMTALSGGMNINRSRFDGALYGICERIRSVLEKLPEGIKGKAEEIRLRAGLPVALTVNGKPMFVSRSGLASEYISGELLIADNSDLNESFRLLCRNSVYAHAAEIQNGFIIMSGGHRAGICGTVTAEGNMRDISSLNIRIAREIKGCATELARSFDGGGMLIAGPPGSGKTTVLRDLIRQLSDGICGKYYRVAVIDSRGELSASICGKCQNDLGRNTDVLLTANRAFGTEMAVRTLFPDIIAFDELGTAAELKSISDSFNAGVAVITTAHIGSAEDLLRRSVTYGLLSSGAVSQTAVLPGEPGGEAELLTTEELLYDRSS